MSNPGDLTPEQIQATIEAMHRHDRGDGTYRTTAMGAELGITDSSARRRIRRIKRLAEQGHLGTDPVLPGFTIKSVASRSVDGAWIKQTKAPGPEFTVPEGHAVKGVSALVDGDGRVMAQWVKTRLDSHDVLVEAIRETFEGYRGRAEPAPAPDHTDDSLLQLYPIADQHNGLLAWGKETGEDYNLDIGADRLRSSMARLVAQAPAARQAIILNLGDWTHNDDSRNVTPRSGNVLDVDGRYFRILTAGVQLMMDCIDLSLQKHETVLVRNIPGNHDPHASVALTVALSAFYADEPRVTIDDDPGEFFYHRFGATLIGATHGHRLKPADMAMAMATRRREDWGATKYHWFLFGHVHHETAKEVGDCRVESFQTLAGRDAHHAATGYSSGQSLTSITLHHDDGEIGRHRVNIAPNWGRAAA